MGRIITIASAKGGVGKTTLVANLATALSQMGKNVIAVDGNLTTSNLGLHVGIPFYPVTLQDVLKGRAHIKNAVYRHGLGFRIIPADISLSKSMTPKGKDLFDAIYELVETADFVLVDSAAGLGREAKAAVEIADEMITISHPELPALTDALKITKIAEKYSTKNLGLVLNMVRNKKYEFSHEEAKDFLNLPLIGKIHDDHNVRKAIANKIPVVSYKPGSVAARQFRAIAHRIVNREYAPEVSGVHKFFGWLIRHHI